MKTTAASNRTLYLVTGAAGFLGGTVCRQLVARGDRVRAFVLPGDKAERYVPAEAAPAPTARRCTTKSPGSKPPARSARCVSEPKREQER